MWFCLLWTCWEVAAPPPDTTEDVVVASLYPDSAEDIFTALPLSVSPEDVAILPLPDSAEDVIGPSKQKKCPAGDLQQLMHA